MAAENFQDCLAFTLKFEGGKSNDPRDPGGKTNQGVTYRTYNAYRASKGLSAQDVYAMTPAERNEIYKRDYWKAVTGDSLPAGVDLCVFDYGVNSGPGRALRALAAAKAKDSARQIHAICAARLSFLRALRTWGVFGSGWTRRVTSCEVEALKMAGASLEAARDKIKAKRRGTGAAGSVAAGGGLAVLLQNAHLHWTLVLPMAAAILIGLLWLAAKHRSAGMRADALTEAIRDLETKRAMLETAAQTASKQVSEIEADAARKQQAAIAARAIIESNGSGSQDSQKQERR